MFYVKVGRSVVCYCILSGTYQEISWWRHQMETFPRNWTFVRGSRRSPVNSPHKGQWRWALMFSLISVWINDWVNNREAGDWRRYRAHYDVIVMWINIDISFKISMLSHLNLVLLNCVTICSGKSLSRQPTSRTDADLSSTGTHAIHRNSHKFHHIWDHI